MTKDGGRSFSFISKEIPNESTDLHKLITQDLHNVYNIHTLSIQSLSVQGQPSDRDHIISIFFVVPTNTGELRHSKLISLVIATPFVWMKTFSKSFY